MYGCTISQFPFSKQGITGEITLNELLSNLGQMVGYNATLIATVDTNKHGPSAKDCYIGQHFDEFKRQFWATAKTLIETSGNAERNYVTIDGNPLANPIDAIVYVPRFENDGIVHSFFTKKQMAFVIDGEHFIIPRGTQIDTGFSKKWSINEISKAIRKSGWVISNELTDGQSTVRGLVLTGKNTPPEQANRAAGKAITSTSSILSGGSAGITPHRINNASNARAIQPFKRLAAARA
jgi:hypothetical protein